MLERQTCYIDTNNMPEEVQVHEPSKTHRWKGRYKSKDYGPKIIKTPKTEDSSVPERIHIISPKDKVKIPGIYTYTKYGGEEYKKTPDQPVEKQEGINKDQVIANKDEKIRELTGENIALENRVEKLEGIVKAQEAEIRALKEKGKGEQQPSTAPKITESRPTKSKLPPQDEAVFLMKLLPYARDGQADELQKLLSSSYFQDKQLDMGKEEPIDLERLTREIFKEGNFSSLKKIVDKEKDLQKEYNIKTIAQNLGMKLATQTANDQDLLLQDKLERMANLFRSMHDMDVDTTNGSSIEYTARDLPNLIELARKGRYPQIEAYLTVLPKEEAKNLLAEIRDFIMNKAAGVHEIAGAK